MSGNPLRSALLSNFTAASRAEAIEKGWNKYFGEPCKHGHGGVRYTRSRQCCACQKRAGKPTHTSRMIEIDRMLELKAMRLNDEYGDL